MKIKRPCCALLLFLTFPGWASFEDNLTGGRATGLDGAMTAASDDVFSLYHNPAAAASVRCPQIGAQYGRFYGGLSDNSNLGRTFFGYLQPLKNNQALGMSYVQFSLSDLYTERTVGLSYARELGERLSLGATFKYFHKSFGSDANTENALDLNGNLSGTPDPVFRGGYGATGWGGDVGATYRLDHGLMLGMMVMNVNEPSVSLNSSDPDRAPRVWKVGAARKWDNKLLTLDLSHQRFTQMETQAHGGFEHWWENGLGARLGGGIGERDYRRITTGFSYRAAFFQVDYGFMMPFQTIAGTVGTHQISLTLRFCSLFPHNNMAETMTLSPLLAPLEPPVPIEALLPAPEAPKKTFLLAGGPKGRILFATDKWRVVSGNLQQFQEFIAYMQKHPRALADIEGHTDTVGSAEYNQKLSIRRATAVVNYLVVESGIARERLTAKGYGFTRPAASNATAAGRQLNRRVVATITPKDTDEAE